MKDVDYRINRKDVYVGSVKHIEGVKNTTELRSILENRFSKEYKDHVIEYRNILFVPTSNGSYTNDLLYNSPNFPVVDLTDDNLFVFNDSGITVVHNILLLSEILEYFGYEEQLTHYDIVRIKNHIFHPNFIDINEQAFGFNNGRELPVHPLSSDYIKPLAEHVWLYRPRRLFGPFLLTGFPVDAYKPVKQEKFVRKLGKKTN